jgi:hypothetical protein
MGFDSNDMRIDESSDNGNGAEVSHNSMQLDAVGLLGTYLLKLTQISRMRYTIISFVIL